MRERVARTYAGLVLGHPKLVLCALFAILVGAVYLAQDFRLDASTDSLILDTDVDLQLYRQIKQRYRSQDFLFIAFTPKVDVFSDGSLQVITSLRDELREVELVDSVASLADIPLVTVVEGSLSDIDTNTRTLEDPDVDRSRARAEVTTSPIYRDLIISPDGNTTALVVNLKMDQHFIDLRTIRDSLRSKARTQPLSVADQKLLAATRVEYEALKTKLDNANHAAIAAVRAILPRYYEFGEFHIGGVPMITDDMITFVRNDLRTFGATVLVFLVVMLAGIFRRARWVLLPLASCTFAVAIMIGLLSGLGWRVTVISSNFVSLMLILTMSMNIHLIVRFRELQRELVDAGQFDLVFATVKRMVRPCLYTALTTMLGFCALVISDIQPVIDFGWMMTIGMAVTFVSTFLLFPSLLVLTPPVPAPGLHERGWGVTSRLSHVTEHHGKSIVVLAVVTAVVSGIGVSRLQVESSFIDYFHKDTDIYQGMKLVDERMGGTTPGDVILQFVDVSDDGAQGSMEEFFGGEEAEMEDLFGPAQDESETWFTPDRIDKIKQVHRYLESVPEIGKVLSLASVIEIAEDINEGGELDTFKLALVYKRIPSKIRTSLIDPYISIPNDEARVNFRIFDSQPGLNRSELLAKLNRGLADLGLAEGEVKLGGLLVLYNNVLQSLFRSQAMTLGIVMLGVGLMLMVLFRSVLLAIIGVIPNALAAGAMLGLMGLLAIPLDVMTITIAAITIGIAVDDCIHYIYRFKEELPRQGGDYVATMHYCHANIGSALVYTSITIVVGFSILVLSNFTPTIYFGLLTTFAMLIALLLALTLLPKLILAWRPF